MLRSTVIVRLNRGSAVLFCLQQCIDCVLNLLLNERQCLVPAKQGVYAIINHGNLLDKKHPCDLFSLKVSEAAFCVGVKTKTSN